MTQKEKIEKALIELRLCMKTASDRDEFEAADDFKRIHHLLNEPSSEILFTGNDISQLQTEVHKITGDGEVMMLFNKMLGVSC